MTATLNITFSASNKKNYLNAISADKVVINHRTGKTLTEWLSEQGNTTQLIIAESFDKFPSQGDPRYLYLDKSSGCLYAFVDNEYSPVAGDNSSVNAVETKANLPAIGIENGLYIIKETNELYRWSDDAVSYVPCAPGLSAEELEYKITNQVEEILNSIEIIQGGNASGFEQLEN